MCASARAVNVGEVGTGQLRSGYRASHGVDVGHLLPADVRVVELHECSDCSLRWYTPAIAGDDRFYEDLQSISRYYQDHKPEYDFAKLHIGEGDRVLEVGCGKGAFARVLPRDVVYRGLEFNQVAIDKARSSGLDVQPLPVADEAVARPGHHDVVCHFQVLEHVGDPHGFLADCVRALRTGGKLIVAVPAEDSFLALVEGGWLNMPPHHLTRWPDRSLRAALRAAGLSLTEMWHEPVAEYHKAWYRGVMINAGLKKLLGARPGLLRDRLLSRMSRRAGQVPFVSDLLYASGERKFPHRGRGHTVCAVATKD